MRVISVLFLGVIAISVSALRQGPQPVPAIPNEFPYQVSIQLDGVHEGTGVIIDASHIITNTFMSPGIIRSYRILAGINDLSQTEDAQIRTLSNIYWNPNYCFISSDMKANNLGILRLDIPLEFNQAVQAVPLAPENHIATGSGMVSSWMNESSTPNILQKIQMPLITYDECFEFFGKHKMRTGRLCSAFIVLGDGSALDSNYGFGEGFPIVCKDDGIVGHDYLCGIQSLVYSGLYMNDKLVGGYPIVFSDIASYIPWINATLVRP